MTNAENRPRGALFILPREAGKGDRALCAVEGAPPPPCSAWSPSPALRAGAEKRNRSRGALRRPSFATTKPRQESFRTRLRLRMIPKSGHRLSDKIMRREREAKRRKAHAVHCPRRTSGCRHPNGTGAPGPPGSGSHLSARGHRSRSAFRECPRERGPL